MQDYITCPRSHSIFGETPGLLFKYDDKLGAIIPRK